MRRPTAIFTIFQCSSFNLDFFGDQRCSPNFKTTPNNSKHASEASHSCGEMFGDQKRHRLVCGKLLEKSKHKSTNMV